MVSVILNTAKIFDPILDLLPEVESRMRAQSNGNHPDLETALNHLLDSGGKRIRPTLALLVGELVGADREKMLTLAAAVELLHTATLVHDDVIDGALLRRGNPTLNARWSAGATILTGDFIFARAAKLAAETVSVEVMNIFAQTLSTIVNGEITQMFSGMGVISRENYFARIYAKTASMFELSAIAPAYISEAPEDVTEKLRQFGYEIGMAFQIMDDILDFTSIQEEVGKPVANDLRQGLVTLPALYYFEKNPDCPYISKNLLLDEISEDDMDKLVDSIRVSDAINLALNEAKEYVQRAFDALKNFEPTKEKQALENLASYVVNRQT